MVGKKSGGAVAKKYSGGRAVGKQIAAGGWLGNTNLRLGDKLSLGPP